MNDDETNKLLKELFNSLPKPIQQAITSADVQKRLRELADKHNLHLDQWENLENEVRMGLFGLKPLGDLTKNIQTGVGVSADAAAELAGDISEVVLAPIRQELERELEHPEAKEKESSGVETARTQVLQERAPAVASGVGATATQPVAPAPPLTPPAASTPSASASTNPPLPPPAPVLPATPPPPPPTEKAARAPSSGAYRPGTPSTARKDIHDDPYREPPA